MFKVLERTISRYVTYSRVLWVLYIIHRKDWQVNKVARDRDSDYCGIAVLVRIWGIPKCSITGSASQGVGGWEKLKEIP